MGVSHHKNKLSEEEKHTISSNSFNTRLMSFHLQQPFWWDTPVELMKKWQNTCKQPRTLESCLKDKEVEEEMVSFNPQVIFGLEDQARLFLVRLRFLAFYCTDMTSVPEDLHHKDNWFRCLGDHFKLLVLIMCLCLCETLISAGHIFCLFFISCFSFSV